MQTISRRIRLALATAGSLAATGLLAGCGGSLSPTVKTATVPGVQMRGTVHGGQQPVVGATMQLYATGSAPGAAGYGSAATPLITGTTVTTGPGGAFNITDDYTCPSMNTPVYLVATGGNSGFTSNPAIALMAALGPCGNLSGPTNVSINELTTVASVYALSPFMKGTTQAYASIGTSTGNALGLNNAMADVNVPCQHRHGQHPRVHAHRRCHPAHRHHQHAGEHYRELRQLQRRLL